MAKPLVAVVGRPNVGKSTLFNAIVNKRISIVEDIPGVTRDRIYFDAEWLNREFTMIDTGGIEFITENSHVIPKMMRLQAELAIEEADVILFVVDGKQGIVPADEEVANILRASGKPVVLVVNKIDSVNQEPNIYEFYNLGLGDPIGISAKDIYEELGFLQFAPILFASALTKQRIHRLADMLKFVSEQQYRRVSTGTLNQLLQDAQTVNPVPSRNGRIPKIYYMTQASVKPPTFILFVNEPELIHFSYMRFLENRLRESFGFEGTPIRLVLRGKKRDDED